MATVTELTQRVENERRTLGRNLTELKTRAEAAIDWRDQVRNHPALMAGAAIGAGVMLAQLGGRRTSAPGMRMSALSDGQRPRAHPGALSPILDALMLAATGAVVKVLKDNVPGFGEAHEKRDRTAAYAASTMDKG